jgi:hypothetical protein
MIIKSTPARREIIHSIECDRCKTTHTNTMEIQEFLSFRDTAGYGNRVVGDMTRWSIDLCQDCWYDLLGPYIQKENPH